MKYSFKTAQQCEHYFLLYIKNINCFSSSDAHIQFSYLEIKKMRNHAEISGSTASFQTALKMQYYLYFILVCTNVHTVPTYILGPPCPSWQFIKGSVQQKLYNRWTHNYNSIKETMSNEQKR